MARKTNAEKQAEQQAEREALEAKEAAEYSHRLMKALEEATVKNGYELTVRDGQFKLVNYSSDQTYIFDPYYTPESFMNLEDLEDYLERLEEERAEANRLYNLKKSALAKLTEEERNVLGL
jgi:hypothetical protein